MPTCAGHAGRGARRRHDRLGRVRPPGGRHRQRAIDAGLGHQDKVAQYLYNGPEYMQGVTPSRRPCCAGQHQLPLHRRRARLPVGQRRRRGGGVPRRLHRPSRVRAQLPKVKPGCGSTTAQPVPPGRRPTRRRRRRRGRRPPPWGVRRRPAAPLHRRHHRHAQGRDVAPGRPVQLLGGGRQALPRGPRRRAASRAHRTGGRGALPACPLMHGTGLVLADRRCHRRLRRDPARRAASTPSSCSTRSTRLVNDRRSWATRSPAAARGARRRARPLGPVELPRDRSSGVMWSEAVNKGPAAPHARGDPPRPLGSSEAIGMGRRLRRPAARRRRRGSSWARTGVLRPRTGAWWSPGRARSAASRSGGNLPVGYYKDEEKTARPSRDRRRPLVDARRLGHGRGRRHRSAARPRLGVHQHRRREGLPRGGRGGAEADRRRARRGRGRRAGRALRGVVPSSSPARGRRLSRRPWSSTCGRTWRTTRRRGGADARRHRSLQRQGRLQGLTAWARSSRAGAHDDSTTRRSRAISPVRWSRSPARCTSRPNATSTPSSLLGQPGRFGDGGRARRPRLLLQPGVGHGPGARRGRRRSACSTRRSSCRSWRRGGPHRRPPSALRARRGRPASSGASWATARPASTGPSTCSSAPVEPLRPEGRPLYGGLASLGPPGDPMGDAWRLADMRASTGATPTPRPGPPPASTPPRSACSPSSTGACRCALTSAPGLVDADLDGPRTGCRPGAGGRRRVHRRGPVEREAVERSTDRQCRPIVQALGDDVDELLAILLPCNLGCPRRPRLPRLEGPHDLARASA